MPNSMTFEPKGNKCALLIVGVANAFGMVGHVHQTVRRMTKHMLKEFQEVSDVSNTFPNMKIWLVLETAILRPRVDLAPDRQNGKKCHDLSCVIS